LKQGSRYFLILQVNNSDFYYFLEAEAGADAEDQGVAVVAGHILAIA
jgi:hypothetical protein